MNRRDFVRAIGGGAAIATLASPAVITSAIIAKPKRDPLPKLSNGEILSATYFGELVDRVNELDAR